MDQQNPNTNKHVPTAEEIARLEAEAVAALQRGEAVPQREAGNAAAPAPEGEAPAPATDGKAPAKPGFVPYVDDVPDPVPAPAPSTDAAEEADDDDDEEYIPSEMEKRINAMSPEQWKRWQLLGGAGVGVAIVACLFVFGQELSSYGLIVAALLAIVLPRYLERAWRCKLNTARMAMIAAMVIGLAILFVVTGLRHGFNLKAPQ